MCPTRIGSDNRPKALLIWDVFHAHWTPAVLQKLVDYNILTIFVPANCTSDLQPLDLSLNKPLKDAMRREFVDWYSKQVWQHLEQGTQITAVKIDLRMTVVKPLSCNWFLTAFDYLKSNPSIITKGFDKASISNAFST